jgi:hypothetical protein
MALYSVKVKFAHKSQANAFAMLFEQQEFIDEVNARLSDMFQSAEHNLHTPLIDFEDSDFPQHEIDFEA